MLRKFIKRTLKLFTNPGEAFHFIKAEHISINYLLRYVAVLSLFTFAGHLIRETTVGIGIRGLGSQKIPFSYSLIGNIVYLVLIIAITYFLATIIKLLARFYNSVPNKNKAMKLVAYMMTPVLIAGIFNIVPILGTVIFFAAFAYGIYLLHVGLPVLMETSKDRLRKFTITISILWAILYFVIFAISKFFIINPYL